MWIFISEPSGKEYKELIDFASELCNEFILVRRCDDINESMEILLKQLSNFLIEIKEQQSWPGTQLLEGHAKVHYYILNTTTKEVLKKYSESLYSWLEPNLLEDLCFIKKDKQPWLVSIAHEQFSWIDNNTRDEIDSLMSIEGIMLEEQ
jgi:hypothetical protein